MAVLFEIMGLDLICEYLIKSSLFLAAALFLVFIFQKKSASFRYFILSFALFSSALIPFLSSVSAGWETKLVPAWIDHEVESSISNTWIHSSFVLNQDIKKMFDPSEKIPSITAGPNSAADNKGSTNPDSNRKNHIIFLIFPLLWILGLLFLWLKIVVGLNGASRLTRNAVKITESQFQQILQQLRKVIALKRKVGLLSNRKILSPITWGVIKPVILLPEGSGKWTKSQCSSVLFHELSHIKRCDFIVRIIARFICAFFWFNPMIWVVYNSMKKEQEKACDEMVLNSGVKPSVYAANLLSVKQAMQGRWRPPAAVLGVLKRSQLNNRLVAVLKRQIKPKEIKMKDKIFLSLIFIIMITVIGLAHPVKSEKMNGKSSFLKEISINTSQFTSRQQEIQETQEKQLQKKEKGEGSKEQEAQSDKENKKGIKWVVKDEGSGTAMLYITDADEVKYITDANEAKKIILDGKIILLEKDGEKKTFSILTDEKECVLEKDDHGNWTINGKKLELSEEDGIKIIKLGELKDVVIKKEDEGSWTIKADKIELIKDGKLKVLKLDDENKIVIQSKEGGLEDKVIKIFAPKLFIKTDKSGHKNLAFYLREEDDEVHLEDIVVSLGSDHTVWLYTDSDELKALGEVCMIGYIKEDEGFKIIFKSGELDETQRDVYAEMLEKIENKLEGKYNVESEINADDNTFIIRIKAENLEKTQKSDMKKLLNEIVGVIKEVKESKKEK